VILVACRDGLRTSELVILGSNSIDVDHGNVHCDSRKNGAASVHPLSGVELGALRRVERALAVTVENVSAGRADASRRSSP
jgi:hypothetical protein